MRNEGSTLLELLLALTIGLIVSSIALAVFSFVSNLALDQENRSNVHQNISYLEDYLRDSISFSSIHPHCLGILPIRSNVLAAPSVSIDDALRYQYPYRIHTTTDDQPSLDVDEIETVTSRYYQPPITKQIYGLVKGSDILSVTSLDLLSWSLSSYGRVLGSKNDQAIKGVGEVLLLLTDCDQLLLVKGFKQEEGFEFLLDDRNFIRQQFEKLELLRLYRVNTHLVYLKKEADERVLIHDHLDGQSFIKTPNILSFKTWFYNYKTTKWTNSINEENVVDYNALAIHVIGYSANRSTSESDSLKKLDLLGIELTKDVKIINPRRYQLNALWLMHLYNY